MSDSLSIAAVTSTLRVLLANGVRNVLTNQDGVTTRPLDRARNGSSSLKQLNLYLYQTSVNPALRNQDFPTRTKSGETGHPPLALDLHYLVTAYGEGDEDLKGDGHQLLGQAMLTLHDHAVLSREEIRNAEPQSDLHEQIERIRITPDSLSVDEMSKLWNTFQTQHRVSAAYKVSVVLIDSSRPTKAPMPVLTRGREDSGIVGRPNVIPQVPTIESVRFLEKRRAAELGGPVTLHGYNLQRVDAVKLSCQRLVELPDTAEKKGDTKTIEDVQGGENELSFMIDDEPSEWVVGFYNVIGIAEEESDSETTNELSFPLVPKITNIEPKVVTRSGARNQAAFSVSCSPKILPSQNINVLVGDRTIKVGKRAAASDKFEVQVDNAPVGKLNVRLRVDGIDSEVIDHNQNPPKFRDKSSLEIRRA